MTVWYADSTLVCRVESAYQTISVTVLGGKCDVKGNDAIPDDISMPLPEVGDADAGRGAQVDDHVARSEENDTSHWEQLVFATR